MSTARYYPQGLEASTIERPRISFGGRAVAVIAVGVLSALTVFLLLCERDHTLLLSASSHRVTPPATQHTPTISTGSQPAPDNITLVTVPTAEVKPVATQPATLGTPAAATAAPSESPVAHATRRSIEFTLARSKRFQLVGPVSVGVWKVDAKHKLYDLSIFANGRRIDRKHVGLNSPVSIPSGELGRPMQLVVNNINRSSVSGYLNETPATH